MILGVIYVLKKFIKPYRIFQINLQFKNMIPFKANPPKCTELYNISIELLYFITLPSLIFNMNHKLYNKPFIFYTFTD